MVKDEHVLAPLKILLLIAAAILAGGASLPQTGPVPELLDDRESPREEEPAEKMEEDKAREEKKTPPPDESLAIETEDPAAYARCLADLKALGAEFEEHSRIDDSKGCGIEKPLAIKTIVPGVVLEPEATMRCPAALALARWIKGNVMPNAKTAFGSRKSLTAIEQASSYVCRLRNNAETGEISEHARGNAIDIAGLRFGEDLRVEMTPRAEDGTITGAFQRTISASACLYFTTVLSPGSDAAHETHLHLDLLERKNSFRYCR